MAALSSTAGLGAVVWINKMCALAGRLILAAGRTNRPNDRPNNANWQYQSDPDQQHCAEELKNTRQTDTPFRESLATAHKHPSILKITWKGCRLRKLE